MPLKFEDYLLEKLKDPREAAAYLQAAILDGEADALLLAVGAIAKAKGGIAWLSKKTGLDRVHLYRLLGTEGNPSFRNMMTILEALGIKVDFSARKIGPAKTKVGRLQKA